MTNDPEAGRLKRLKNLVPVKKGQVLNPKGRGIGKNIWNWAAKLGPPENLVEPMRKLFKIPYAQITVERAIVLRLILEAVRGDLKAVELWMDRKYGKVTIPMDVSTTNDGPLVQILNVLPGEEMKPVIDVPVEQLPATPDNGSYPTKDE